MRKLAVVAFGGNALLKAGQKGTVDEQELNAYGAVIILFLHMEMVRKLEIYLWQILLVINYMVFRICR